MKILATLALILVLGACTDSTGSNSTDHVGVYTMTTINGDALPATLSSNGADSVEVTAGTVTLNADRTFSETVSYRITKAGAETTEQELVVGLYSRSRNHFNLNGSDGSLLAADLDGTALTMLRGAFELVYQK